MVSKESTNQKMKTSTQARTRALVAAAIVAIASITGVAVSAQVYALKGLNGQLNQVSSANWLPVGLNATFSHAMLYRNAQLRAIAKHEYEKGSDGKLMQYAQALLKKVDDWDSRLNALLTANNIPTDYSKNELNKSYQQIEDLATTLATLEGAALDKKFKAQMQTLATQITKRLQSDISLLDDKTLEGIAAEIAGSNNSVSQEINAG